MNRTFAIADVTPREVAELFAHMSGADQAEVLDHVWQIAREWPGAGWCQQSYDIARFLTPDGRSTVAVLANHALAERGAA